MRIKNPNEYSGS